MSTTRHISKMSFQRDEDGAINQWRTASLAIFTLVLLLVAVVVYAVASTGENVAAAIDSPALSQNPELSAARRYAQTANQWKFNPELNIHQRFSETSLQTKSRVFQAVNPELNSVDRYTGSGAGIETISGISNPELGAHQRFSETSIQANERSFLAVNPELKIHRRYVESSR